MQALCSMLLGTYYAQNYASIIGGSLLFRDRDCQHERGCFVFFRMRLDATAGACIAFLCAFRTLIALLLLQYYLDRLMIHIIDFTIHHYPTVVISAPNEVSAILSQPRGQIQAPYCCFPQYSLGNVSLNCSKNFVEIETCF